ncbi:MAG: hypothetical protein AB3N11_11935 [Arenibacterium sp.]
MSVHFLQKSIADTSVHVDADAARMMILQNSDEALETLARPRPFGSTRVVVTARFPSRQVLTMGRTAYRN